jgi:hypothetical protein
MPHEGKRRRRWGIAAATLLAVVALVPQVQMWRASGRAWHGSHLSFFFDEAAYAAYINALIDGRPRRSDPYTGRDNATGAPQAESLFSIQFVPAYAVALPARLLGVSASTAFIALSCLAAFASALALYQLLFALTNDDALAATGALSVLCFASLAQKLVRTLRGLQTAYLPLPFLRRYLPAAPLPLFFLFCTLIWRALSVEDRRASNVSAVLGGVSFALLVFSYFYLWTAAAAWLACLALLWLAARPPDRRRALRVFAIVGAIALAALAPYFYLLSHRAPSMDAAQALACSRRPELFRTTELICLLALLILAFGAWRGRVNLRARASLFAASFALMPFVVFNQQIITGRTLQPVHYEQFIANYVCLIALALAALLVWRGRETSPAGQGARRIPRFVLASVALAACAWGVGEAVVATRGQLEVNIAVDEARPVGLRLREIARTSPPEVAAAGEGGGGARPVVFFDNVGQIDRLPSVAPQAVLWAPHMFVFSGASPAEEKERLYQYLYYSGVDEQQFHTYITRPGLYYYAIFGWGRTLSGLSPNRIAVTPAEIETERRAYADYLATFTRERAARLPISYVIADAASQSDLTNLDRWYTRDAGERVADYIIYRVQLRP